MKFQKVVICGIGLIGGSFALALKQAGMAGEIVGFGRRPETLQEALERGVIDQAAGDWAGALAGAELVMLAVPVGQMPAVMAAMAPHLAATTLVTDAGSTKSDVVAAARVALGVRSACFVPGHPIAGAEKSGVGAASADLFRGKRAVLTPLEENAPGAVDRVAEVWAACGAEVSRLAPDVHDRIFAAVSHLPHVLAYALVHEFAGRAEADLLFGFSAGGFRDFTRIASSSPEMWRDICLANRHALLAELDAYMVELMRTRVLLAGADAEGLLALFAAARQRREDWLHGLPAAGE